LLGDPQKVETSKKAEEENQGFEKLNILWRNQFITN
jgi:hypothetical protein